jgi:hypothetical protein
MKHITAGTIRQCLDDYFKRFGRTPEIKEFTRASNNTETRWRCRGGNPEGDTALRLIIFLELCGYRLKELESVPIEVLSVARCVALGIISIESVCTKLENRPSDFLYYLRGKIGVSRKRWLILRDIAKENEAKLAAVIPPHQKKYSRLLIAEQTPPSTSPEKEKVLDADVPEDINRFSAACACIREIGTSFLAGPDGPRRELRSHMNKSEPELHLTWDVLHKLMKERKHHG